MIFKPKKIAFLTGTRADFGKIKSLIKITQNNSKFITSVIATGMHLQDKYGRTIDEIQKSGIKNISSFPNHGDPKMDIVLSKTIEGVSNNLADFNPDLLVVHGDRVESLAGAISGTLNNILVAHIEGGEVSGTVDEIIRHAVSKLSHIHFVSNKHAQKRLIQLGEVNENIFIIGSPDLDLMNPKNLPSIDTVKAYYEIDFDDFAIVMYHPVTTELNTLEKDVDNLFNALESSGEKFIVIYPNNDSGSDLILKRIEQCNNKNFRIFPSLRFEYFLRLLKEANYIIGNSSAGIREAPFYSTNTINIGSRQHNRAEASTIINCDNSEGSISDAIISVKLIEQTNSIEKNLFGEGDSDKNFLKIISSEAFWEISNQKYFQDLDLF